MVINYTNIIRVSLQNPIQYTVTIVFLTIRALSVMKVVFVPILYLTRILFKIHFADVLTGFIVGVQKYKREIIMKSHDIFIIGSLCDKVKRLPWLNNLAALRIFNIYKLYQYNCSATIVNVFNGYTYLICSSKKSLH